MGKREILFTFIFILIFVNLLIFLTVISVKNYTGYVSAGGLISLIIESNPYLIYILSPLNQSYSFEIGENYTFDLNVSAEHNYELWYYKLEDVKHNLTIINYTLFTPNSTFEAVRWGNKISVIASDADFNWTSSVDFFVYVPNSAPVIHNVGDYEQNYACENDYFSYDFLATDIDEDILSYGLSPYDPFYIRESQRVNLSSMIYNIFSSRLSKDDVGRQIIIFYVADEEYTDFRGLVIEVIEVNNPPQLVSPGVITLWTYGDNSSFNHQLNVTDLESGDSNSGNFSFNISFSGEFLFNISSNGTMSFIANNSFIGVHNVSVCVEDNGLLESHINQSICGKNNSFYSCVNFSITITNENRYPTIIDFYPGNQSFYYNNGISINFNITKYDPDGTIPDSYWYVNGERVEYLSGNVNDFFNFSSVCNINNYDINVEITDGLLNDSFSWDLSINPLNNICNSPSIGGGGGGGSGCNKKIACNEWGSCNSLDILLKSGEISGDFYRSAIKSCLNDGISEEFCGFQTRNCTDLLNCLKPANFSENRPCYYISYPNCFDGIKNCHSDLCEILIDCGGPCFPCSSCSDGIQNQGEEEIDCGGPCLTLCREVPKSEMCKLWFCCDIISCLIFLLIIILIILVIWVTYKIIKIKILVDGVK